MLQRNANYTHVYNSQMQTTDSNDITGINGINGIDLSPADLGLPDKFEAFRPAQLEAIDYAATSDKRFVAMGLPTGAGKSLIAAAIQKLTGLKAVYLTATKGLQDQVGRDFGAADVRGRANYDCHHTPEGHTCDSASDICEFAGRSDCRCPYTKAVEEGKAADLTVTNYAYWLHSRRLNPNALGNDWNPVELLILDEAHETVDQLTGFLEIVLKPHRIDIADTSGVMPSSYWVNCAALEGKRLAEEMAEIEERNPAGYRHEERWKEKQEQRDKWDKVSRMDVNWVWQVERPHRGAPTVTFSPIWPGRYAEALFSGVQKIILLSATLRPYTLRLLGIKESDVDFREWPAVFSPNRGMVYHVPTAKLTWKAKDEDYKKILDRVDEIIGGRLDRKGIIHTVSYDRAKRILSQSKYSDRMFFNESSRLSGDTARDFRDAGPGSILCSPSYSTGFDFPGEECEYQIVLKTPYPNTQSRVIKERCESNDYRMYAAAQELVQMCGRARRYEEDRSETIIVDNGVSWLLSPGGGKKFLPGWFRVWTVQKVPNPPPKL